MNKTKLFFMLVFAAIPFLAAAQNSRSSDLLWSETTNSQSNQVIYYYPINSDDDDIKPIDYETTEMILKPICAWHQNSAEGLPKTLDGSSEVVPYSKNQKWEVYIGHSNKNYSPNDIVESYDKGLIIGATSWVIISQTIQWLFKTEINGQLLYEQVLNHNDGIPGIFAITQDSDGNLYAAGTYWNDNIPPGMPLIIKFNPCGEPVWCKYLPVTPQSIQGFVCDIIITSNNELIALVNQSTGGQADQIFLAAFDLDGKELWIRPYAKKSDYPLMVNQFGWKLIEHNNGYYIAGECYYPYPNNPDHVFLRPLFIGIDSSFKEKWVKPFHALDSVFGWAETVIPINDSVLMGGGIRRYYSNNSYALLMFVTLEGEELGYSQITNEQIGPDNKKSWIKGIDRINDSLFISTGFFGPNVGSNPVGEMVFDSAANLYNKYSRQNVKNPPKMVKTHDNNFVIAASKNQGNFDKVFLYKINADLESVPFDTTQNVYDSLCPHPIQSGTIDLTDCPPTVSIGELPSPDEYYESIRWIPLKAYPNPVSGQELTIEFENTQHHSNMELRLYDAFGKEMHRRRIYTGQQDTRLDVSHCSPGLYLAVVYSNGGAVGRCKVMVE